MLHSTKIIGIIFDNFVVVYPYLSLNIVAGREIKPLLSCLKIRQRAVTKTPLPTEAVVPGIIKVLAYILITYLSFP